MNTNLIDTSKSKQQWEKLNFPRELFWPKPERILATRKTIGWTADKSRLEAIEESNTAIVRNQGEISRLCAEASRSPDVVNPFAINKAKQAVEEDNFRINQRVAPHCEAILHDFAHACQVEADKMEGREKSTAEKFAVEFIPSAPLRLLQTIATDFAKRKYDTNSQPRYFLQGLV